MTDGLVPRQLLEVAKKVDARLDSVLAQQLTHWESIDPRLCEAIAELQRMITSGGKRLRAAFCYWAWRGVLSMDGPGDAGLDTTGGGALDGGAEARDDELVIDVGAAFEFLQVFALIHDDIMDNSATRRGATTVHVANGDRLTAQGWIGEPRRFGEGVAILVGDLGHVYADQLTGPINRDARRIWDELRIELNLGQYLDMRAAAAGEVDRRTAQQVATFKTALYTIVRPLQLGASLQGRASRDLLDRLDRFGRPLGRAFQLRDDALGLTGDEKWLGKPVGDDLREGKPTEIVSFGIEHASVAQQQVLDGIGRRDLNADDVARIIDVLHETGALQRNEESISKLLDETHRSLADLPFDKTVAEALASLANYVAVRNR